MAKKPTKKSTLLKETLGDFLFNQIKNSADYQAWAKEFELPNFITDNLAKPLREYQLNAVKAFIWLYENEGMEKAKHLLFNMATGSGKTLTMSAVVLYLYELGYRNFIFLVHQSQIKDQAIKNFTDPTFDKYLFKKQVKLNGKNVIIKKVERFNDAKKDGINFLFFTTALLYNRITATKENSINRDDFANNLTVIIADEAHRLNVDTKKKTEVADENNWEKAVQSVLHANPKNLLLEFTATVDLNNNAIHQKYSDKLIYKYDFLQFNKDGFSKDVKFLFNEETQIEDQKRRLIVNAITLSEYRRLFAERVMKVAINPIILVKSTKIAQSGEDREFFHKVINSLRVEDFEYLKQNNKKDLLDNSANLISQMFDWLAKYLGSPNDMNGLKTFIAHIKERFAENNTMIYNSQAKDKAELLPFLDSPRNTIRAIFSVNALNEGWDVLSLYDIIHFDISASKKVSLQDIQLIGRGARLCPYDLPKSYELGDDLFGTSFVNEKYKRKFDNSPDDNGRILETFYYHFVKTGVFLDELQKQLLDEGIVNQGVEKLTIRLKNSFMQSQTYQNGFVLVNEQEYRKKTDKNDIDNAFNKPLKAGSYRLHSRGLTDKEQNKTQAHIKVKNIQLTDEYFSKALIRKALVGAENGFFRFKNIKNHITDLDSIDTLINDYLPKYQIVYSYEAGKDIDELTPNEKLQLLIGMILPEVRKMIDKYLPQVVGSKVFKPKTLSSIFKEEKNIYLVAYPMTDEKTGEKIHISNDERSKEQTNHSNQELSLDIGKADWYAYSENYGTSEEKRFVKFIDGQIDELKNKHPTSEIYLIRNELDYYLFNIEDGRRFSPDYMLIINDIKNKQMYYQCLIEPKGGHLLAHDEWKEKALINLADNCQISFDGNSYQDELKAIKKQDYQEIKCLGFRFFNSDTRGEMDFGQDFCQKLL